MLANVTSEQGVDLSGSDVFKGLSRRQDYGVVPAGPCGSEGCQRKPKEFEASKERFTAATETGSFGGGFQLKLFIQP